jgi:CTP synthase
MASQFHPEFRSRPSNPHPLFRDFIGAVAQRAGITAAAAGAQPEAAPTSQATV